MELQRAALWVLKGAAALIAVVVMAFSLFAWLGHPKFSTDNIFIRPAGNDVFKMSDIPRAVVGENRRRGRHPGGL